MTIKVTRENIESSRRDCAYQNPIALAFLERTGVRVAVVIFTGAKGAFGDVIFGNGGSTLPKNVADRIAAYDETGQMEPFEFELDVPKWMEGGNDELDQG